MKHEDWCEKETCYTCQCGAKQQALTDAEPAGDVLPKGPIDNDPNDPLLPYKCRPTPASEENLRRLREVGEAAVALYRKDLRKKAEPTEAGDVGNIEPWHGHHFKEVSRGRWECYCGKVVHEAPQPQQAEPVACYWMCTRWADTRYGGTFSWRLVSTQEQADGLAAQGYEIEKIPPLYTQPDTEALREVLGEIGVLLLQKDYRAARKAAMRVSYDFQGNGKPKAYLARSGNE